MKSKIIVLNGPSSSGKSTLARLLKKKLELQTGEKYGIVSIDQFLPMSLNTKIYEDDVYEISYRLCHAALQMAKEKHVIIDHVITSQRIFQQLKEALCFYEWHMVLVTCPLDELLRREQNRKNRCIGTAEASFQYLYPKDGYDAVADTFHTSLEDIINQLILKIMCRKEVMRVNKELHIVPLLKEEWAGRIIPMEYTSEEYFDLEMEKKEIGYEISFHRRRFDTPVSHDPEEYDFPDKLYQPHWEKAYAWGITEGQGEDRKLLACIETCPEEWSNRLIVTELWVHEALRRQGIGHRLMAVAKEQAVLEHRRAIILETQSCNTAAIQFYEQEGFELIGFDSCCYSNHDRERKEVRMNMGFFFRKNLQKAREHLVIRKEEAAEYHETEQMVLSAFWNKYRMGCDEHLLVHKLRSSDAYLPQLSRIAVVENEIVGAIYYAKAWLKREGCTKEILVFGPLCVSPKWQGCGIGGRLLNETLELARKSGYEGVIIFGEPDYYPRHGFLTCDHFGVTTSDGKNFDAFMGLELVEGGLKSFGGRYMLPDVFSDLSDEETEVFTKNFHTLEKQKFPGQWQRL